jgi:hypothetical protein
MRRTAGKILALLAVLACASPALAQFPLKWPRFAPQHAARAADPVPLDPKTVPLPPLRPARQARAAPPVPILRPEKALAKQEEADLTDVQHLPLADNPAVKEAGAGLQDGCLAALAALGARYAPVSAKSDPSGCRAPRPLSLSRAAGGVTLTPAAIVNCSMARALGRWTANAVVPAARKYLGREVIAFSVAASYVCRRQASGKKLSEHAFANAIDIKAFTFDDGTTYSVGQPVAKDSGENRFAAEIRRKACDYFRTVLGPGADADHRDHFHLDLRGRQGGYRLCQ